MRPKDAAQIQYNVVRVDGQRSAYIAVMKQGGDSNTIAVVDGIKDRVAHLVDVPKELVTNVLFDQSLFVKSAIENLLHEGAMGLILTGLMILIFLGSLRATVGVFLSIPLSVLATFIALALGGSTVNTMILGGLALGLSRLIDNSVVVLENIFRHLEIGESPRVAAEEGGKEVALAVLAATLTAVVVFFPVTFLYGVSRFLFSALALAVVLSLFASYFVAMTVVPLFCAYFIKAPHHGGGHEPPKGFGAKFNHWFNGKFDAFLDKFEAALRWSLKRPVATVVVLSAAVLVSFGIAIPMMDMAYFPRTDPGQFVINLKAPTGTRIENTEKFVQKVEDIIRQEVKPEELAVIVSNLGITPDFSAMYSSNSGQHTAFVQVSLKEDHRIGSYEYMARVRRRLGRELPQLTTYFQSGGLVDAVINLGLPAPLDIQVDCSDLHSGHHIADELARRVRNLPGVADVYVPQDIDYPALRMNVDRDRAAELGLSSEEIIDNVITALSSGVMIAPSYWIDPKSGLDYFLTVQYPEDYVKDLLDLQAIPVRSPTHARSARLESVSHVEHMLSPTEVDHYQLRRVIDVYVAPAKEDLGRVLKEVNQVIADTKLPSNARVSVRGSVQGMQSSFKSFGLGLILAIVLVYLILVAQFKSFIDPFIILLAVPTGLIGVALTLMFTDTSLNVMSLMGIVMMVGIVTCDSILILEFARQSREDGMSVLEALVTACRVRMRPILMTTLATFLGLLPMALKMGTGSEAYAPLARAIVGGLAVSGALTMFMVPAAYLLIYRREGEKRPPTETAVATEGGPHVPA